MVADDCMYIVGGSGANRYGDVHKFDFSTLTWSRVECAGEQLAEGRYAHSAVLIGG